MKKKLVLVLGVLLVLNATNVFAWGGFLIPKDQPPSNPKPLTPPIKGKAICGGHC
jgi:hypothetical protein